MQQFSDDINEKDDDSAYLERRERRRARRLEKKRRREMFLRGIKMIGVATAASIVIICIGFAIAGTSKENKESQITENNKQLTVSTEESIEASPLEDSITSPIHFAEAEDVKEIASETIESANAILVDADNSTIIAKKSAYERIVPASMTKVLTVLVAAEAMTKENLDDTFTMTLDITDYAYVNDCSSVGFLDGEVLTVRDLFYGTVLASGGDAAVGLATYIAGSHDAFVEKMNEKLVELGISDTAHFTNCVGIYDEELYCTTYDMAVIMYAAMQNELCREVLNARTYTTSLTTEHPEGITISNWFMRRIEDKDTRGEVMGAKTGYVVQSGNCAVSYQEHENGTTYICVTADSTSSWKCIYDQVEIYNSISE